MNDPQIWTLIGVFAAIMLGGMTLMTTLILRNTTTAVAGLREEMIARFLAVDARFAAVDARFTAVDARFTAVDARLDTMNTRIDHLDRDITLLMRRAWGEPTTD